MPIPQKTKHIVIIKTKWLKLFRELMAILWIIRNINTLRRQYAKGFNAEAGGAYVEGSKRCRNSGIIYLSKRYVWNLTGTYTLATAVLPLLEAPLKSFFSRAARPAVASCLTSFTDKTMNSDSNLESQGEPYVALSEIWGIRWKVGSQKLAVQKNVCPAMEV